MNNSTVLKAAELLDEVRRTKPLIHQITNYVTINDCANVTLAVGASPIMAEAVEEAAEISAMSSALVLNIGSLHRLTIEAMLAAGKQANKSGVPVILDPVGVGASALRNRTAEMILDQVRCSVIRGNISEIRYLAGYAASTRGVDASESDSSGDVAAGIETAKSLAQKTGCTAVITGATDIMSDGTRVFCVDNGHEKLGSITGTGCMCTALIGSFCGVASDYMLAAAAGLMSIGIAGERAFERAGQNGLGSYHVALIDEIGNMSAETMLGRAKLYEACR